MLVQGLQDEDFKAIRVAAGDSVSLAISDRGELRAWGSFRVSPSRPHPRIGSDNTSASRPARDSLDSTGNLVRP